VVGIDSDFRGDCADVARVLRDPRRRRSFSETAWRERHSHSDAHDGTPACGNRGSVRFERTGGCRRREEIRQIASGDSEARFSKQSIQCQKCGQQARNVLSPMRTTVANPPTVLLYSGTDCFILREGGDNRFTCSGGKSRRRLASSWISFRWFGYCSAKASRSVRTSASNSCSCK